MFENEEKPALLPLNAHPYELDEIFSETVRPDFHLIYETNRYSVPWTLVGMSVTVRVGENGISVFYQDRQVAFHPRSYRKHQNFTTPAHAQGLIERKPGASHPSWRVAAVRSLGPSLERYLKLLEAGPRSLRHETSRLLALATVYGKDAVHQAVEDLLSRGIVGVDALTLALKANTRDPDKLPPEPLRFQNEKLNREPPAVDLRRYDAHLFGRSAPTQQEDSDA
jgi:hypothetical protein